jgi:streptogramin lyase
MPLHLLQREAHRETISIMKRGRVLAFALLTSLSSLALPAWAELPVTPHEPSLELPKELQSRKGPFSSEIVVDLMGTSQPVAMIALRDGGLAFSALNLGAVGRVNRERKKVSYIHLGKGARPSGLAEAPDGTLFIADRALNVIHRISAETGEVTRVAMPPDAPHLDLAGLRIDHNGTVWFAGATGWLGSLDTASGQVELSSHDDLQGLGLSAIGENGSIWFVAGKAGRMVRIGANRSRFDSAGLPDGFRGARGLSVAANGDVWITSYRRNTIGVLSGRKQWRVIALPFPESQPQAILARKDGTILVADGIRRVLYRYLPAEDRFDEVGKLGEGGNIKALIEVAGGVAAIDMAADQIRYFMDDAAALN